MVWFIPVGLGIGLLGTQTVLKSSHGHRPGWTVGGWWLLAALSWLPALCWIFSQFVDQAR